MNPTTPSDNASMQRSIAGRLLFWFLVIALIPCAILTAITARIAATALEASVRDNLVQIAAAKAGELEAYAGERVRDASALARGPTVVRAMQELATATATSSCSSSTPAAASCIPSPIRSRRTPRSSAAGSPIPNSPVDLTGRGRSCKPISPASRPTGRRPSRWPS